MNKNEVSGKDLVSSLIKERKQWQKIYGIDSSRLVFNPLIRLHIKRIKADKD